MNINQEFETIIFEECEGVGILTINRPKSLNALNDKVLREIKDLLLMIRKEKDFSLRGLLLIGSGEKAFVAGADISQMNHMTKEEAYSFGEFGQEVSLLIETMPIPVIALVNGYALGGGLEIALSADFMYSTKNAVFGLPEVSLGLIPGFGGTQRLSRVIGMNHAKKLIYTAGNLDHKEAHDLGLVLKVFETREELLEAGIKTIKEAMKNSPLAISKAKVAVNTGFDLEIKKGLEIEVEQFSDVFNSDDMKEGTTAFLEKRRPNFLGK